MSLLANSAVIGGEIDVGDIGHSLRFRAAGSTYASRTFSAPTSNTSWALSLFDKRGTLSTIQSIFSAGDSDIRYSATTDTISITKDGSVVATSTAVFRDITAPVHLFFRSNGTNIKGYRNTEEIISYTGTIPDFNSAVLHTIGKYAGGAAEYFDGYRSRICFVDGGGSLTPQDFVTFNSEINEWVTKTESQVKAVVDAGGNNSTMLDFDDATSLTTLGYDKSTHGNHWTLNNFSLTAGTTYDHSLDVPGNNYATLNPLANPTAIISNANLTVTGGNQWARGPALPDTDKWYFETTLVDPYGGAYWGSFGIAPYAATIYTSTGHTGFNFSTLSIGGSYVNGVLTASIAAWATNDVIGVAYDATARTVQFYRNNVAVGALLTVASGVVNILCYMNGTADTSTQSINFGQRPFAYTPPVAGVSRTVCGERCAEVRHKIGHNETSGLRGFPLQPACLLGRCTGIEPVTPAV